MQQKGIQPSYSPKMLHQAITRAYTCFTNIGRCIACQSRIISHRINWPKNSTKKQRSSCYALTAITHFMIFLYIEWSSIKYTHVIPDGQPQFTHHQISLKLKYTNLLPEISKIYLTKEQISCNVQPNL